MLAFKIAFLTEAAIVIAFIVFVVFQVIIPLLTGTPFFPILRKRPHEAVNKLAEAIEEKEIHAVEQSTAELSVGQDRKSQKRRGA